MMPQHDTFFECLEPRRLLAGYVVDNIGDVVDGNYGSGETTLREAILLANGNSGPDSVAFHESLADGTITLDGSQLYVTGEISITGLGADRLAVSGDSRSRVLQVLEGANASISGLTITAGNASDAGGILNSGTLALTDTTVSGNHAHTGGGIMNGGTLTLTRSTVSGNTATNSAGISNVYGTVTLIDSAISANTAAYRAGGIWSNSGSTVTLIDSTVSGNTSNDAAGGIYSSGTLTLAGSIVTGNFAPNGGGIIQNGTATLTDSTVSGNNAFAGAGIYSSGLLTLVNSTVSGNAASANGGGILNSFGTTTLTGSTVSGNSATEGGGIYNSSYGILTLTNSTISGNAVSGAGGGIYNVSIATLTVYNSTIAFNSNHGLLLERAFTTLMESTIVSNNTGGDLLGTLSADSTHNLIQDSTSAGGLVHGAGNNIVGVDPHLASLAFNGGPTQTHALLPDSQAIDSGSNPLELATDQRGFARTQALGTDIGAFELPADPTIGSLTSSGPSAVRGQAITFIANTVTDAGGSVARVAFYLDANHDGIADAGELIGSDTDPTGGYTLTYTVPVGATLGATTFLAVATDNDWFTSVVSLANVSIMSADPTIGSLTSSGPSAARGQAITFWANTVTDADGSISRVAFYLDANHDGIADLGELIGSDTDPTGGYTLAYAVSVGAPLGATPFLAVATDNGGHISAVSPTSVTVTSAAPTMGSPVGTADADDAQRVVSVNGVGHVLVYEEGWGYQNLSNKTGAPPAIGDAIIWTDPKDGLTYVAAPTEFGLIVFTRSAVGAWSSRNLSTQTGATSSPVGGLTQFTTVVDRVVIVAGITADGRIVAFQQTLGTGHDSGPTFTYVDISADLTARGQQTPQFVRGMISYVPVWDTWHLAGIDKSGNIQTVWINPRKFTSWRTDNLSAITGAAALSGQLAVTLTSWRGINLTGLNAEGEVVTTWWVPRFGGKWANNNLTKQFSGSKLTGGNITGFISPSGSMNYIGIDSSGEVTVYWWTPVQRWVVSLLVPATTPAEDVPSGALTSAATSGGTLNVYGNNSDGDVLRYSWPKPVGAGWNIENLTDLAVPM